MKTEVDSVLDRFLKFEKEVGAFEKVIFGRFFYWNQIRQYLYEALLEHYGLYSYEPLLSGEPWTIKKKLAFFKDMFKNEINFLRAKKRKKVLFACTSRNMDPNGFATDSLINDYKASLADKEYYQIELFNNLAFDPETKYNNRYFNHLLLFLQKFTGLVVKMLPKTVDQLITEFRTEFGREVNIDENVIRRLIASHIIEYYFFRHKLKRLRPTVVIASQWVTGLAKASNELGIPFAELQHGSFSANYTLMYDYPPEIKLTPLSSFSRYFFTFSEYWNKITLMPGERVAMGNSYLYTERKEKYTRRYDSVLIVTNKDFTPIFIPIVKNCARQFPQITFNFKLHSPEYEYIDRVKDEFKSLSNVAVIYNEHTTNELLQRTDVMFTIHSTVLYQALQLGVKAIILKRKYYWISEDALDLENVFLVQDENEIVNTIGQIFSKPVSQESSVTSFFQPFERSAFLGFLDRVTEKKAKDDV